MSRTTALLAAAALAFSAAAAPALGQEPEPASPTIVVAKDKSAAFRLDYPVGQIVVAQPETLELVATTDRSFYVRGKALGVTNLLVYDRQKHLAQVIDVRVGYDVDSIQSDISAALPGEQIKAINFAGGVLLTGHATNNGAAARAMAIAERYAPKSVQSELDVAAAQQVQVEVRMIEVSRQALRDVGFNFNVRADNFHLASGTGLISGQAPQTAISVGAGFGGVTLEAGIRALEERGVLRTLAQPNLIAMSGQEASFLAGGEFPYPIPQQNGQIAIEFKPFGVKLNITPVIQASGQIQLKVAPEVSQLDNRQKIRLAGFDLPSLTVRRAQTNVELRDGESFAIAGLFSQDYINNISQVPGASNLPVLGALFRSASWKRQETELVIIVTPHLSSPTRDPSKLPNPLANGDEPSAIDVILNGIAGRQPMRAPGVGKAPTS
ncbi:MAG TPA: type II and III secretion system protein family protein [Caulobacteraceae bacterium]|jgi:pilus assembly protein CpaC